MKRSLKLVIALLLVAGLFLAVTAGLAVTAFEQVEGVARFLQAAPDDAAANGLIVPVSIVRALWPPTCRG